MPDDRNPNPEHSSTPDRNPNLRPHQEPVQRAPGDQADTGDLSQQAEPSLPDDMRPDQRPAAEAGTNPADNKGTAPIPPTPPGQSRPNPVRDPDDVRAEREADEAAAKERQRVLDEKRDADKDEDKPDMDSPRPMPSGTSEHNSERTTLPPLRDKK